MRFEKDPIGYAIHDYNLTGTAESIIVKSDLCEDDVMPIPYLFRTYEQMPDIEKFALAECQGEILDIGACAGCHSIYLKSQGFKVTAIDISKGACDYLKEAGITSLQIDFMQFQGQQFDTILLLMNGIGLAGSLTELPKTLRHLRSLLNPNGRILCDSTDIRYMYENRDGSVWMDLNANYYGEMNFNMVYKNVETDWFPWLYVDQQKLTACGMNEGFDVEILLEGEHNHYLAELKMI